MILSRRVALDGAQLDQVDERILIQAVEAGAGKDTVSATPLYGGSGSRVTNRHRESLDIAVKFTINEKSYHPEERADVLERVVAWAANGGWLTVNYKPGRKIRVIAAQLPGEGDARKRNQYTITFRAYGVPYWQSDPAKATVSGTDASGGIEIPGSAETLADVQVQNISGMTVESVVVGVGDSRFHFGSLGLGGNETLVIDHQDDGEMCLLRIRIKSAGGVYRSVMDKRIGYSSDDLRVKPGAATVLLRAQRSCRMTVSCPGRFA